MAVYRQKRTKTLTGLTQICLTFFLCAAVVFASIARTSAPIIESDPLQAHLSQEKNPIARYLLSISEICKNGKETTDQQLPGGHCDSCKLCEVKLRLPESDHLIRVQLFTNMDISVRDLVAAISKFRALPPGRAPPSDSQ